MRAKNLSTGKRETLISPAPLYKVGDLVTYSINGSRMISRIEAIHILTPTSNPTYKVQSDSTTYYCFIRESDLALFLP